MRRPHERPPFSTVGRPAFAVRYFPRTYARHRPGSAISRSQDLPDADGQRQRRLQLSGSAGAHRVAPHEDLPAGRSQRGGPADPPLAFVHHGPRQHHGARDVPQGEAGTREEEGDHPVRLSREKMMQLSHVAIGYLKDEPMVEFFTDPGAIRAEIFKFIENEGKVDEAIDLAVRQKIETQKRGIPEGSEEWDI